MWFKFVSLLFAIKILLSAALSTSKSPGGNFDLSNFKLNIPDDDVSTISADELEDGYEDKYFYTASDDGAMMFYVPKSGGTTSGSSYPRTELREQCKPGDDDYNWDLTSGTHQINGQYRIDSATTSDYFIIQQIHSKNGPGKPLCKIRYVDGYIRVEIKSDEDGDDEVKTVAGYVGNDKFWMKIIVKNGYVKTYLNGERITNTYVADYWGDYLNYFKTGCYKTQSDSDNVKAYVRVYSLTTYHSSSSLCKDVDDAFTFYENGDSEKGLSVDVIAIIVILLFVILAGCAVAGYCVYKKKKLTTKQYDFSENIDGEEDKIEVNDGGDTKGYDMTQINNVETEKINDNETEPQDAEEIDIEMEEEEEEEIVYKSNINYCM